MYGICLDDGVSSESEYRNLFRMVAGEIKTAVVQTKPEMAVLLTSLTKTMKV